MHNASLTGCIKSSLLIAVGATHKTKAERANTTSEKIALVLCGSNIILSAIWLVRISGVGIVKPSRIIPAHIHLVRKQWVQGNNLTPAITDNMGIGIAMQQKMAHHGFPKNEAGHFRIWLIMQKMVKRMAVKFFLAAIWAVLIHINWQPSYSFCQNPHTGINSSYLHGSAVIYSLA